MKKILIATGISFTDAKLIEKEVAALGECELYRIGVKYNESLFKNFPNIKIDKAANTSYVNPNDYDEVLIFRDFGYDDVNSGVNNLAARCKGNVRIIDNWDKNDKRLFPNKITFPGTNVQNMLKIWEDVIPMGGTFIEKSMCSVGTSRPYMKKVLGSLSVDLKGDLPSMRIEMGKQSIRMFYVFRYIFPEIFSRTVWYGFMCHRGMVYCLYGAIPTDPYKRNTVEITRVTFYPGTNPTTADIFSATLRTMNPYKSNLAPKFRNYDIQKYDSLGSYIEDPDCAYLLSQDKFVGVNIQSGGSFLMSLDENGKIKTEGLQ